MLQHAPRHPRIDRDPPRRPHQNSVRELHEVTAPTGARRVGVDRAEHAIVGRVEGLRAEISRLRFVDGLLRGEIADRLGVRELDVSRILKDEIIRAYATSPDPDPQAA